MIRKELKHELPVAASAKEIWGVYSSPDLPKLIVKLLPSVFEKIEIIEGDGGVGTVLRLTYPPGSVPLTYKEKFVTIDNKKQLKEVMQIEGGYLDMGCTFYMDSFHILENGCDACIIVSKTEYEVPNEEIASKVEPFVTIDSLASMATAITNYVLNRVRKVLKNKLQVAAPAKDIWDVYSSPDLPKLIVQLLPGVFEKIEIVEGNGGVGTVLRLTFPPGSIPLTYKEKFVTIDDQRRLKEVKQIEGGYLDMGCTFYMDSFRIKEKGCESCVIVSKTEYEVPNKDVLSKVEPYISIDSLANMATAISNYEKLVTIDDQRRLKEVKQIEGGYLDMGCTFYMDSFRIKEKGCESCVIVSKTEYEVHNKDVLSKVEPYISIDSLANMATAISNYVLQQKA
ncbi:hypothetical protein Sjap_004187 [Stephania japonica]|uniref:Bet v I/Major latex protein domain-containing protein n=1 Tax=Stephania japonica TaxID=461633 RepID=A0AAP0K2Q5_9MAGN